MTTIFEHRHRTRGRLHIWYALIVYAAAVALGFLGFGLSLWWRS